MKFRMLLATLVVFCFSLTISAQTYSVRVTYNSNLRASYSLDARIVDSAAAGATLTVTGSREKWLKIDRNGREVWMADWIPMTRVDGPQAPADVDNCCFVDRQCNTDHEWTDGYWAYQRNECSVGRAPAATSADTSDVNNCCFTGWLCHTQQDWENGFHAYQANRCLHRGLAIEGPESVVAQVHAALDLMQTRAPNWYGYVVSGLTKLHITPDAAYSGVYSSTGVWSMPPDSARRSTVSWVGGMVHEACHVHRQRSGQRADDLTEETICTTMQRDAARDIFPTGERGYINWLNGLLANINRPECQWWHDPANHHFAADC